MKITRVSQPVKPHQSARPPAAGAESLRGRLAGWADRGIHPSKRDPDPIARSRSRSSRENIMSYSYVPRATELARSPNNPCKEAGQGFLTSKRRSRAVPGRIPATRRSPGGEEAEDGKDGR
jgi:hypothetical protein